MVVHRGKKVAMRKEEVERVLEGGDRYLASNGKAVHWNVVGGTCARGGRSQKRRKKGEKIGGNSSSETYVCRTWRISRSRQGWKVGRRTVVVGVRKYICVVLREFFLDFCFVFCQQSPNTPQLSIYVLRTTSVAPTSSKQERTPQSTFKCPAAAPSVFGKSPMLLTFQIGTATIRSYGVHGRS